MKVLWVCNIMLPVIAEALHREASNKEGWLSGLLAQVAAENDGKIELAVAFPAPADTEVPWRLRVAVPRTKQYATIPQTEKNTGNFEMAQHTMPTQTGYHEGNSGQEHPATFPTDGRNAADNQGDSTVDEYNITCYGFHEDTVHPDHYQPELEEELRKITEDSAPDVIHCFGTEYPHTLAVCRAYPHKERILLGIQGICTLCAEAYFADLPEKVIRKVTFRDLVRRDTLRSQQEKFARRGGMEREAISLAGNITGRTAWDRAVTTGWNPQAHYYSMNETLRATFYEGEWSLANCEPYSIFVSQGDYPLKGLHYLLLALPRIREKYPKVQVYVAGNDLTAHKTLKEKLKISAYGNYMRRLIREGQLEDRIHFLGRLTAEEMKDRFLKSNLFLCCSSLENSPNSLGEAMLLGVPCVSTEVGGIPSLFEGGRDGLWCEGHRPGLTSEKGGNAQNRPDNKNNTRNFDSTETNQLENIVKSMANSIIEMWDHPEKMMEYSKNAREHARKTHDKTQNFAKLQEIYANIAGRKE